ncbi:DUF371 domain-containing protein [Candidatus Bathyarchaeota archaeon]|nr:DUF371 domain-containing protein [Candidatus Bathyarchaeota archaeon]
MVKTEVITAYGHRNIQATHRATFEITKDESLTRKGDCIIAVKADKGLVDLSEEFKEAARNRNARITITIEAGSEKETVNAFGDSDLSLSHKTDVVVRKSNYVCSRTLAVKADKAACDLSRSLVKKLRNPNQMVKIIVSVTKLNDDKSLPT